MIGTTLKSRYKIIQLLREGGLGETYLAEDLDIPIKSRCVVKRLKPAQMNPDTVRLFEQEAITLSKLGENHPQIPKLYAYFEKRTFWGLGKTHFYIEPIWYLCDRH